MGGEARYSAVLFPDRPKILGLVLEAPQLGHLFLLWRRGRMPIRADVGGLCEVLYILSRNWREAKRGINKRWIKWRFKLWAVQLLLVASEEQRAQLAERIAEYLDAAWEGPEFWEEPLDPEHRCASPFLQVIKVRLMHLFHLTPEEALDYPLNEAIWDTACYAEDHGKAELVSDEMAGMIDKAHKVADEIRAKTEGKANG
jgi:hypothetical protein